MVRVDDRPPVPLRVLVTGGSGFIGRHLCAALRRAGHDVRVASRSAPPGTPGTVRIDMSTATHAADWRAHLDGVDVVVNAVGILREQGTQTFRALHTEAPMALFDACVQAGVARVVQVSALGADADAQSDYHLSKRAADRHLLALPLDAVVVQPSLVHGAGGASARMFGAWATLPCLPLPGRGGQQVQPIQIDDLTEALVVLVTATGPAAPSSAADARTVALVGPEPLSLRDFLLRLRRALGRGPAWVCPVPMPLVRAAASAMAHLPGGLLDGQTLAMLERGNTAPAQATTALLGRPPRPVEAFVDPHDAGARAAAVSVWALPLLRWSVGLVWIVTGLVSMGLYPVEDSRALLARVGLQGGLATLALYGAAVLDLLLGIATLWPRRPRHLWAVQGALILGYMVLITFGLPEFWLHPYGPILKNLPMLAAIALLAATEAPRRWTT